MKNSHQPRSFRRHRLPRGTVRHLTCLILAAAVALGLANPDVAKASSETTPTAAQAANTGATRFRVTATDGAALRLREAPNLQAAIIARLPEGTVVTLSAGAGTEADGERWLPIKSEQAAGWVAARYLVRVEALTPVVRKLPADASFGQRVAAAAESMLGQPYVWAGNAPGGFDCSGLIQWVYNQAGVKMPRTLAEQLTSGTKVDASALQVGDLLSFVNTYQPGLSHAGIYLGSGRFVNAADEAHGVTISNLQDEYWQPRFYRAVRVRA